MNFSNKTDANAATPPRPCRHTIPTPDLRFAEAESLLQLENEDALDHTALGAGGSSPEN